MEEATQIGCLTCFTGNSMSKNQPNHLLIESVSSKLELLPSYEKLSHEIMPGKMPQDLSSRYQKHSKWSILGASFSSGMGTEREERGDKVMKRSSWLPNAKGKRWPVQGWS
jgi:hypothetical protein